MTGDSDKGTGKEPGNSVDTKNNKMENKTGDNIKSRESGGSSISGIISNLKKFTFADELNPEKQPDNSKKPEDKTPENPKIPHKHKSSKNSDKKDVNSQKHVKSEDHAFNIVDLLGHDFISSLKTKKDRIVKGAAILIGVILILYGLILISASVTKVADNVIFGEKAMLSTFLILLGVLIIVSAFAQRILNRTFLNKIHTELEVAEGRSTESDDSSKKVEDENGNKVGKDNKDNIVGENKR